MKHSLAISAALLLALPSPAYASSRFTALQTVSVVTGVTSLLLSAMLLIVVVQLRRVADGSAIVEHISYVVGASLCLVAAILVGWIDRFVEGFSTDIVRVGGDILVMVSLLLFAVYFTRVKRALASFLQHMHTDDILAAANSAAVEEETVA